MDVLTDTDRGDDTANIGSVFYCGIAIRQIGEGNLVADRGHRVWPSTENRCCPRLRHRATPAPASIPSTTTTPTLSFLIVN